MYCIIKRANILSLPTFACNKFTITSIFNILQKLIQILELIEMIIYKKIIILKNNLLII